MREAGTRWAPGAVLALQVAGWLVAAWAAGRFGHAHVADALAWATHLRAAAYAGALAFVGAYTLAVFLWVPASLLTLVAGFVYGPVVGVLVVSPASVAAATLQFVAVRALGGGRLAQCLRARYPAAAALLQSIPAHGLRTVVLLRLAPVLPFNLVNGLLALAPIRLRTFIGGSALGMLPGTIVYVALGATLPSLQPALVGSLRPVGTEAQLLRLAGALSSVLLLGWLTRQARRRLGPS